MLRITSKFCPVRIIASIRNEVEMDITIENKGQELCWAETDVILPEGLSLAYDKLLRNGRLRVGIISPNESKTARCKIYATSDTFPGAYNVDIVGYAYSKDGIVYNKGEARAELRCVRIWEKE